MVKALKKKGVDTNENPQNIIQECTKDISAETLLNLGKVETIKRMIRRARIASLGVKELIAASLKELVIPVKYHVTIRNERFYFDDSGQADPNRVIVFTSSKNLDFLESHSEWYMDGTFEIAPGLL